MSNEDIRALNILIENELYNIVLTLKEENKPNIMIVIAIENFKERYAKIISKLNLDRNYIENYLIKMYEKLNGKNLFNEKQIDQNER